MGDELRRLREDGGLFHLLGHYVQAGTADRDAWLDRRMELGGAEPKAVAKLHGELLACGWLEQNTGVAAAGPPGACPRCYRATAAGRRALYESSAERDDLDDAA